MTLYCVEYEGYEKIKGRLTVDAHDESEAEDMASDQISEDLPNISKLNFINIWEKNAR